MILNVLLEQIVTEAGRFAVDAGSLYVVEDGLLRFVVSPERHDRETPGRRRSKEPIPQPDDPHLPPEPRRLRRFDRPDSTSTTPTRFPLPEPYHFNKEFDGRSMYRTRSLMVVPLKDPQDTVIGVLQLINALDAHGKPVAFSGMVEELVLSLASQAAVALRTPISRRRSRGPLRLDPTAVGRGRIPGPGHLLPHPEDEPVLGPDLEGHGVEQGKLTCSSTLRRCTTIGSSASPIRSS